MDNSDPNTGGEPLDANYDASDLSPQSLRKMEDDCNKFQEQNAAMLDGFYDAGYDLGRAGHDFWLTRNGHGSGFWDENAPEDVMKALTDAAHAWGQEDIEVGDDGQLHLMSASYQQPLKAGLLKKADPNEDKILAALKQRPMTSGEIEKTLFAGGKYSNNSWPAISALKQKGLIVQKQMRWHLTASIVRGYAITGARRTLQTWDWHALNIALQTMRMNPAMAGVMGGPNEAEARKTIKRITGKEYEELPESMKRGKPPRSIPASLRPKKALSLAPGTTAAGEEVVPEQERPVVAYRKYRCMNCGHEQPVQTNHEGKVINYCNECSWKPSWRGNPEHHKIKDDGMSIPFNGRTYRPFEYVGPWDFNVDKEDRSKTVDPYSHPPTKGASMVTKTAMSRKDYILIADVLKSMNYEPAVQDITQHFAEALKRDNPRFDADHFTSVVLGKKELTSRPPRTAPGAQNFSSPQRFSSAKKAEWSDDPEFANWQQEVAEGNTRLGFDEWLEHMIEAGNVTVPELPVQAPQRSLPNPADIKLPGTASAKPRLAGAKPKFAYPVANYMAEAKQLIERNDPMIFDVAANKGQIVDNVKHMSWFVREVAEWLAESDERFGGGDMKASSLKKAGLTTEWEPIEDMGSYMQLRDGELWACPMNADGSREEDPGMETNVDPDIRHDAREVNTEELDPQQLRAIKQALSTEIAPEGNEIHEI